MNPASNRVFAAFLSIALLQFSTTAFSAEIGGANKDKAWFLIHLKQIADDGAALNPAQVSQLLDLKFELREVELVKQPPDCSNPYSVSSQRVQSYKPSISWYKPTAHGIPHMSVPRAFINPAEQLPDPSFAYKITHSTNCTGDYAPATNVEAKIEFYGLPAFDCITADEISAKMGAEHQYATDGVSLSIHKGRIDDASGTNIEFVFRMGVQCALSATLTQEQNAGYRYLRAKAKSQKCAAVSDHQFCSTRQAMGWEDGNGIDQMDRARVSYCGMFATVYAKEPLTGRPPPGADTTAVPRVGGPCTGK